MKVFKNVLTAVLVVVFALGMAGKTMAATTVDLGSASPFAILAGEAVTNVPTSAITGNVGLYPAAGSLYSGLTQAEVTGTIYSRNAAGPLGYVEDPVLLLAAKNDLTAAYIDAAGRGVDYTVATELGGQTLTPGVYDSGNTKFGISAPNPLILDGQGDPNAVFIFEMGFDGTGLTVGPGSEVQLTGSATACNVFWVVNTASINTTAVFKGTILALNSITVAGGVGTGANIEGRLLARDANVTLDHTTVAVPICTVPIIPGSTTPTPTASSTKSTVTSLPLTGASTAGTNSPLIWLFAVVAVIPISLLLRFSLKKSSKK